MQCVYRQLTIRTNNKSKLKFNKWSVNKQLQWGFFWERQDDGESSRSDYYPDGWIFVFA